MLQLVACVRYACSRSTLRVRYGYLEMTAAPIHNKIRINVFNGNSWVKTVIAFCPLVWPLCPPCKAAAATWHLCRVCVLEEYTAGELRISWDDSPRWNKKTQMAYPRTIVLNASPKHSHRPQYNRTIQQRLPESRHEAGLQDVKTPLRRYKSSSKNVYVNDGD